MAHRDFADSDNMAIGEGVIDLLYLAAGALFLYLGAESLVYGSSSFALRLGIHPLVIGLVIVGLGTSLPEAIVSVRASMLGRGDIAVGNVIGSNLANIGLVLGFSALCRPVEVDKRVIEYEGVLLVIISCIASLLFWYGEISRVSGFFLLCGMIVYIVWAFMANWSKERQLIKEIKEEIGGMTRSITMDLLLIGTGIVLLPIGGESFLKGSIAIAEYFGISDAVIGLTIVAFGTSLPELATSIVAIVRKHADLALGNIIGSCIFNILGIIGLSALIHPILLEQIHWFDYGMMTLMAAIILAVMFLYQRISRLAGGFLFLIYSGYISYLVISNLEF